ncbi:hypothetical protein J0910_16915 [Nocardiopsis sp. CNT-189]
MCGGVSVSTGDLAGLVAAIPLYVPVGEVRRARVSSLSADPVSGVPTRAVVDFGSTPEGADAGPELEVATRLWPGAEGAGGRVLRGLCAERALMELRARDPLGAGALSLGEGAVWSEGVVEVDGRELASVVVESGSCWVAAVDAGGGVLVRVYARAPGPGRVRLRRVADAGELEPLRGRG